VKLAKMLLLQSQPISTITKDKPLKTPDLLLVLMFSELLMSPLLLPLPMDLIKKDKEKDTF
jgi:hypothetical protein